MPRIVLKDLETEKVQSVPEADTLIGRDPACGIFIDGPKSKVVSGRHARVFFQDNSWWIEDISRNGTVLDDERLQQKQRHALKVGQVIGLGESGPRLRVAMLESRKIAETMMELPDLDQPASGGGAPKSTTAPRQAASSSFKPPADEPSYPDNTAALRRSEAIKAGLKFEEPTEPMSPAPDWLVKVTLRNINSDQRYEVSSLVVKLGRSPDCHVQVPPELGASVSRSHAELTIEEGGVVVRDAGSRNGTFVNGQRIDAPHPAVKGDQVMLGSGGPTFAIDDLHIVKAPSQEAPPGGGGGGDAGTGGSAVRGGGQGRTPDQAKPINKASARAAPEQAKPVSKAGGAAAERLVEPRTDPTEGSGKALLFKDVLDDLSQQSARRFRFVVWGSVATAVIVAVAALVVTQSRVDASERRLAAESRQSQAPADSLRRP
jgi:pSer/pThr/pTyr-binding forkhead associated (FHA) protein